MKNHCYHIFLLLLLPVFLFAKSSPDLAWPDIQTQHKPGTYWWWLGSAVDEKNLTANLESLNDAGIGAAHIIPIYGVKGEEENYIDFLSPEWMNMLAHTTKEAKRLNMIVDMSTTTGWPFGGTHVTPVDAASKIVPTILIASGGEKLTEKITGNDIQAAVAYSETGESIDLINHIKKGVLSWTPPKGDWRIIILNQTGTKQMVKRAAPGNEGLVLDPFSKSSLKTYLKRYDEAFANYNGPPVRAQYHDSYEYYNADWTDGLFAEFKSRRGYDLKPWLSQLFGTGAAETISRVKADYRTTMAELHLEYIQDWNRWSHKYGWITRNEAHGGPTNMLDVYAASDIPETETFGAVPYDISGLQFDPENISESDPPNPLILKFSSSAAHVAGKPLVASETCTWLRDHFKASLAQAKPEIDQLFTSGINHLFYHGNAYSPVEAEWPGWMFYASTHFEQKNAFWRDIPALNAYIARCQAVLQNGTPANDILLYWPVVDVWHAYSELLIKTLNVHTIDWLTDAPFGALALSLMQKGYAFDYISDAQILNTKFNDDLLQTEGARYKTIVIPPTQHIPLKTWNRLLELAASGATIIAHQNLPKDVPGMFELEQRRNELQQSISGLQFESVDGKMLRATVGSGKLLLANNLQTALRSSKVHREEIVDFGAKFIRRRHDKGLHYFFVNHSDRKIDRWIALGENCKSAVILDPLKENRAGIAATRQNEGKTEIYLQLESGASCIVRTFANHIAMGKQWRYLESSNQSFPITGLWNVEFVDGGPELPSSFTSESLGSWTGNGDDQADRFAGTARYRISFEMPDAPADDWLLDLGQVCESARVIMNGQNIGTLWSLPLRTPVGDYLQKGKNTLEIEVTNLSANRLRDLDRRGIEWQKYFFVNVFYKKFDASVWPLMDSGLLGPVHLTAMKRVTF
jgi:hypothetical protein